MPPQGRLGDLAQNPTDAHGCPACPHPTVGPAISGSSNVLTNRRPSLRVDDQGIHAACCGPNMWTAKTGCSTVLINGKPAHRLGDKSQHCGGMGQLIQGSQNVIVGERGRSGGGGGSAKSSQQSAAASSSSAPPPAAAAPPPPESPPAKPTPPKRAPAKWNLVYDDGRPVRGFRSRLTRATAEKEQDVSPDGQGQHEIVSMEEDEGFSVVPTGTEELSGQILDHEGKPMSEAQVQIARAFGPPVEVVTDGSGRFKMKGLLEEEPFEAVVHYPGTSMEGRFIDEKGKPVAVSAALWLDQSRIVELPVAADGRYKLAGRKGDTYELLFVACKLAAEGRFLDEVGRPLPAVRARARLSGGRVLEVTSDAAGCYRIPGLMPEESYSLEVISGFPRSEGKQGSSR